MAASCGCISADEAAMRTSLSSWLPPPPFATEAQCHSRTSCRKIDSENRATALGRAEAAEKANVCLFEGSFLFKDPNVKQLQ